MVWYSIVEGPMRRAFRQCGAVTDGGGFGKRDTGSVAGLPSQIDHPKALRLLKKRLNFSADGKLTRVRRPQDDQFRTGTVTLL